MDYNVLTLTFCLSIITVCTQRTGELNDKCRTVDECRSFGYFCGRNRTCQCLSPSYIPNKYRDKCVGVVDQTCKYDEHCIEGAFCQAQSKCKCKEYFNPNQDGTCSYSSTIQARGHLLLPLIIFPLLRFCL